MQRVQLIILWLICCTGCCLGNNNLSTDQSSTDQLLSTTTHQDQQSSDSQLDLNSSFLTRRQLIELKRSISSVHKDMRIIENGLKDPNLARDQLIDLQRKANKRMQLLERRISKYIRQSVNLEKIKNQKLNKSPVLKDTDQVEEQLSSTNQIKIISDKKKFFSSSSSSFAPSDFLYVDAVSSAAASTKNGTLSSTNFGNLSSSVNYSSNSIPSNSINSSEFHQSKIADFKSKLRNKFDLPKKLDLTNLTKEDLKKIVNVTSSINESKNDQSDKTIKSKLKNLNLIKNSNNLNNSDQNVINQSTRKQKHPFLLYHKCSEGYVQLNDEDQLSTGMNPSLLPKSELIINYLTEPHNHQLQIQTKSGKHLCFNDQGRPEIMAKLNEPLCTFQIVYHKKEYIQLNSVWNSNWTLGFNRRGIPIRTTSHRHKKLKRKSLNLCTLFLRQRSDKQLLQRLIGLNEDQQKYNLMIDAHSNQIKLIEKLNNPLKQDSLLMAKIEQSRKRST